MAETSNTMAGNTAAGDTHSAPEKTNTAPENTTPEKDHARENGDFVPTQPQKTDTGSSKKKGPEGGFDNTPVPRAPAGWTVKFTLHGAKNLPLADINTLSADPFIVAQLTTALAPRHKEDPPLMLRTPTVRQNTDPVWDCEWVVANVPASGFRLKCRIYDEDPADHDDRLGNVHVDVPAISDTWAGLNRHTFAIRKRMVSKRAWLLRALAVGCGKAEHMTGTLTVSVEVLGRTSDEHGGRAYTIGPQYWIRHYSPLLGRLLGQKEPDDPPSSSTANNANSTTTNNNNSNNNSSATNSAAARRKPQKYNFQSNQMQLRGPVPEAMYHRYVEFKPFVKSMFTAKGVRGFLLSKALHHQHARVYNFDNATEYRLEPDPTRFAQKFLDLVHYDHGGRIFTYVLTLDALFRFTETGKEFGIDMLSKHTMHSDVAAYVAFSGEFFIRRKHRSDAGTDADGGDCDPANYELVIDNDSGTYRPNAQLLPQLKAFMQHNFPGLHVTTLDCQADAEKMAAIKEEQRERKKREGDHVVYTQVSRSSSMSSSDVDELDRLENGAEMREPHLRHHVQMEVGGRVNAAKAHVKDLTASRKGDGDKS